MSALNTTHNVLHWPNAQIIFYLRKSYICIYVTNNLHIVLNLHIEFMFLFCFKYGNQASFYCEYTFHFLYLIMFVFHRLDCFHVFTCSKRFSASYHNHVFFYFLLSSFSISIAKIPFTKAHKNDSRFPSVPLLQKLSWMSCVHFCVVNPCIFSQEQNLHHSSFYSSVTFSLSRAL